MSDLGLGNLAELKAHVLAGALATDTAYDAQLTAIGRGVAAATEQYCNRLWKFTTGATAVFGGGRNHYFLPRYPLASTAAVTKVEYKDDEVRGWVTDAGEPIMVEEDTGKVFFGGLYASDEGLIRVTYSGGYWYDETEDGSGTLTSGATALPYDVKLAWLLQCGEVWNQKDRLGVGIVAAEATKPTIAKLDLAPFVKAMLGQYVRYQMT